jgi:hypothetical protein
MMAIQAASSIPRGENESLEVTLRQSQSKIAPQTRGIFQKRRTHVVACAADEIGKDRGDNVSNNCG